MAQSRRAVLSWEDRKMAELGLYEAMRTLRAVRRLRPDPIPAGVLHRVLEAATWAPTGGNAQPWRIIAVMEAARKERLGALYSERWAVFARRYRVMAASMEGAARERFERTLGAGDYLAAHFGKTPVVAVFCFNPQLMAITDANLGRPSVVGGGSVYTAVENLLLACRAEGLGCVLTTLLCECEPQVRELLAIPEPWGTAAAIPIGYPVGKGHGPLVRRSVEQLTFVDSWGKALA
jgi:nitroreductase